jgi:DNA integrity scanning protein DisA with diadenylate cyclase activity
MYLTSLVFHTGFAVLVIVLIVVFQEDLRQMFERVAGWGSLSRFRPTASMPVDLDALVEATFNMAASKTGALIVMKGSDPLERHLDGGIALGGALSKPLIYSLFDASSPGHDGAVVMDRDRVRKFAVHLPISKNHKEIAGRGTRHSAALGLSECCDALIVVVSEERGVVSVAESGHLKEMPTAAALKSRVERFLVAKHPGKSPATWQRFVAHHWREKFFAAALAVVAWFVVAYNPSTIQRTYSVPLEYSNLPNRLVLNELASSDVRVTLSGSDRNFRFVDPGSLRVTIDLRAAVAGQQEFPITEENINLPNNVALLRVEPSVIWLDLRKQAPTGQAASGPQN